MSHCIYGGVWGGALSEGLHSLNGKSDLFFKLFALSPIKKYGYPKGGDGDQMRKYKPYS